MLLKIKHTELLLCQFFKPGITNKALVFCDTIFFVLKEILKPLQFNGKPLVVCSNPFSNGISFVMLSQTSKAEK